MDTTNLCSRILEIAQSSDSDKEKQLANLILMHDTEIVEEPINLVLGANKIFMHGVTQAKYEGWKREVKDYFARFGGGNN